MAAARSAWFIFVVFYLRSASADETPPLCTSGTIGHVHTAAAPSSDGIITSVCCPATCERCGGVDCWAQPGGLACCAAHVHALGAPPCARPSDTGCVLPKPTIAELPKSLREPSCLDVWTAVFPGEKEDWKGRSCSFKVQWGQCSKFYSSCQCSCGYCLPTHTSCSPSQAAEEVATAPAGSLSSAQAASSEAEQVLPSAVSLPPHSAATQAASEPAAWEAEEWEPSSRVPYATAPPASDRPAGSLASGGPSLVLQPAQTAQPAASGMQEGDALPNGLGALMALASGSGLTESLSGLSGRWQAAGWVVGLLSMCVGLSMITAALRCCCRRAGSPDSPPCLRACSRILCGSAFVREGSTTGSGRYTSVRRAESMVSLAYETGTQRAAAAAAALEEEDDDNYDGEEEGGFGCGLDDGEGLGSDGHRRGGREGGHGGSGQLEGGGARGGGRRGGGSSRGREEVLELDAEAIYGVAGLDEAQSPRYETPELDDEIGACPFFSVPPVTHPAAPPAQLHACRKPSSTPTHTPPLPATRACH